MLTEEKKIKENNSENRNFQTQPSPFSKQTLSLIQRCEMLVKKLNKSRSSAIQSSNEKFEQEKENQVFQNKTQKENLLNPTNQIKINYLNLYKQMKQKSKVDNFNSKIINKGKQLTIKEPIVKKFSIFQKEDIHQEKCNQNKDNQREFKSLQEKIIEQTLGYSNLNSTNKQLKDQNLNKNEKESSQRAQKAFQGIEERSDNNEKDLDLKQKNAAKLQSQPQSKNRNFKFSDQECPSDIMSNIEKGNKETNEPFILYTEEDTFKEERGNYGEKEEEEFEIPSKNEGSLNCQRQEENNVDFFKELIAQVDLQGNVFNSFGNQVIDNEINPERKPIQENLFEEAKYHDQNSSQQITNFHKLENLLQQIELSYSESECTKQSESRVYYYKELQNQIESQSNTIYELKSQILDKQSKGMEYDKQYKALQEKCDQLEQANNQLCKENEKLNRQKSNCEGQNHIQKFINLEENNRPSLLKFRKIQKQFKVQTYEITKLKNENQELEELCKLFQGQLTSKTQEIIKLQQLVQEDELHDKTIDLDISALKEQINKCAEQLEKQSQNQLDIKRNKLGGKGKPSQIATKYSEKEMNQKLIQRDCQTNHLEKDHVQMEEFQKEITNNSSKALKEQIMQYANKCNNLCRDLEKEYLQIKKANEKHKEKRQAIFLQNQNKQIEQRDHEKKKENKTTKKEIQQQQTMEKLQKENLHLNEHCIEFQNKINMLTTSYKELEERFVSQKKDFEFQLGTKIMIESNLLKSNENLNKHIQELEQKQKRMLNDLLKCKHQYEMVNEYCQQLENNQANQQLSSQGKKPILKKSQTALINGEENQLLNNKQKTQSSKEKVKNIGKIQSKSVITKVLKINPLKKSNKKLQNMFRSIKTKITPKIIHDQQKNQYLPRQQIEQRTKNQKNRKAVLNLKIVKKDKQLTKFQNDFQPRIKRQGSQSRKLNFESIKKQFLQTQKFEKGSKTTRGTRSEKKCMNLVIRQNSSRKEYKRARSQKKIRKLFGQ